MSQGQGGGRPKRWETAQELSDAIDSYFNDCTTKEKPPGIYGLADFTSQDVTTLYEYESGDMDTETERFSRIIRKARIKVIAYAESKVYDKPAGATLQMVNLTKKMPEPYKNAQSTELTGKDGADLFATMTDEQLDARIAAALSKN